MDTSLETGLKANREVKSTTFSLLFGDDAPAVIDISNTFGGTNYDHNAKVVFTPLVNALSKGRINDLSFILDDRLIVLVEHQSSLNNNMAYRMFQYIAETYRQLHADKDEYRERMFTLQRPKFIVLYNGPDEMSDDAQILRLSDMFAERKPEDGAVDTGVIDLELTVKMYNINRGRNENMVKRCARLYEYSILIGRLHQYRREKLSPEEAAQRAVVDCIDQNVLKDFLLKHKGRIINMITSEWNMDLALEVRGEEKALEERLKIAKNLIAQGLSVDAITKATGLTVDEVLRLK